MAILLSRRLNVLALSLMLSAFAYAQKSVTVKFSNESAAAALRKVEHLSGVKIQYLGADNQHMFNVSAGIEVASTKNKGMARTDRMYFSDRGETVMGGVTPEEFPTYYHDFVANNVPTFTDGLRRSS